MLFLSPLVTLVNTVTHGGTGGREVSASASTLDQSSQSPNIPPTALAPLSNKEGHLNRHGAFSSSFHWTPSKNTLMATKAWQLTSTIEKQGQVPPSLAGSPVQFSHWRAALMGKHTLFNPPWGMSSAGLGPPGIDLVPQSTFSFNLSFGLALPLTSRHSIRIR